MTKIATHWKFVLINALFICSFGWVSADDSQAADFFVAPGGSDSWTGRLALPSMDGSDGPFASLKRAKEAVRALKEQKDSDILVLLRGGVYRLSETVVFGVEDSGRGEQQIIYAAYPGEKPVFSSAVEIEDWQKPAEISDRIPEHAREHVVMADVPAKFLTLYDDEGRLPRARTDSFIPTDRGSRSEVHFPRGLLKNQQNVEDVEVHVRPHHAWIMNILPLAAIDEREGFAETSVSATYAMNPLHFLKETESVWFENVLEALDEPGEWVLNSKEGKLYLWPRSESAVYRPRLREYIRVEGIVDFKGPKDIPARNIVFRGLTFMHGDRYTLDDDDAGLQHDWDMLDTDNALVRFRGAENCVVERCHFANSGGGAIRLDLHAQKNRLEQNHIEKMGGAGILLCGYGPGTKDVNKENKVHNNHIHDMGQIYWHSPGIMVWQSGRNHVSNNLIYNGPYCGMIVSGFMEHFFQKGGGRELTRTVRWHEIAKKPRSEISHSEAQPFLHTRNNLIEYNEIHHVMEKMGDGNGIYIRGAGPYNVIQRNYIHHLVTPMIMQAAIRTDGGQRDTLIQENIVYKCMSQGIIVKLNNRAVNNFIVDILAPPRGYYLSLREGPMTGAILKGNVLYSTKDNCTFIDELPPGRGRVSEDRRGRALARAKDAETDYNVYFCAADPSISDDFLAKSRLDGIDQNSIAADPLFVDPANGDFRLSPDSPVLKMGIRQIDVSQIGLKGWDGVN